jgi:hypothetical protein
VPPPCPDWACLACQQHFPPTPSFLFPSKPLVDILLHTCYYEMALAIKTNVSSITRYIIRFSSFVASISRLVEWSRCSTSLRNGFIISSQVGLASPCHTFCHPLPWHMCLSRGFRWQPDEDGSGGYSAPPTTLVEPTRSLASSFYILEYIFCTMLLSPMGNPFCFHSLTPTYGWMVHILGN